MPLHFFEASPDFADEFKRAAVGLLASSHRPLSQIARELSIPASMSRAWRDAAAGGMRVHAALE
jgi:transposase-like protein